MEIHLESRAGDKSFIWLLYYFINSALGSNYVFLNTKPTVTSLFNILPPWPYYIIFMELIGIACFLILYLPFIIKDWQTRRVSIA